MRALAAAALALALALVGCRPTGSTTLEVGGRARHFDVFAPPGGPGMPLVIVLHGNGGTGPQMRRFTHLDAIAAREQFVVVYPDAVGHHWNDGRPELASGVDDVAFVASLIDEMARRYAIDRHRVYVTGISNGAIMSYRLACELGDRIAAIAPVAGDLPRVPPCTPPAPVSVLAINGTADPLVPYGGGEIGRGRGTVLSAAASTALFAHRAGCGPAYSETALPDRDPDDGTRSELATYTACPPGVAVELVTVEHGGHTWPGGVQYLPRIAIGATARDFDGSELIWQFFAAHPRA